MAIKRKISKADYEALSDDRKELYKENPSRKGEYILDMDDPDNELRTALDRTKQEKTELQTKLDEITAKLEELEAKGGDKDKDKKNEVDALEALKKSYETKIAKMTGDATAAAEKSRKQIVKLLADSKASEIATKISKVPKLMSRAIRDRLDVDLSGDEPKLTVLDADGKPSAFTLEDLEQEFVANAEYADIIIASKASGGDTGRGGQGGGNAPLNGKPRLLTELTTAELQQHMLSKVPKD